MTKINAPVPLKIDHLAVEGRVEEVHLSGEIPDLELDERGAGYVVFVDFVGAFEKQSLIG